MSETFRYCNKPIWGKRFVAMCDRNRRHRGKCRSWRLDRAEPPRAARKSRLVPSSS